MTASNQDENLSLPLRGTTHHADGSSEAEPDQPRACSRFQLARKATHTSVSSLQPRGWWGTVAEAVVPDWAFLLLVVTSSQASRRSCHKWPDTKFQTSSSYDGNSRGCCDSPWSQRQRYFLAVISMGSLLIATFLTLAEMAAPAATCSKVSWKSHSQRPGLEPSPSALPKIPQAMNCLYYIPSISCTELWLILQRSTWGMTLYRKGLFMSALMLFFHRLTQRAQGRWHHSHQSPQNGHLKPLSSVLPHMDDTFASAVASSPWPETSACALNPAGAHSPSAVAVMSTLIKTRRAQGPWIQSAPLVHPPHPWVVSGPQTHLPPLLPLVRGKQEIKV